MKTTHYHIFLFPIIIVALALAGCSNSDKPRYRIGVSQCSRDDWREKLNEEITREMMFHDDIDVEIRSADDNNDKQIADIRYFMDNGFDIIIAAPNEAAPVTPVIREAYEKGIPVITFDRDIIDDSYTAHIEVDNFEVGQQAARYAASLFPAGARIIEITGLPGSAPAHKRHQGFVNELQNHPGLEVIASAPGNWDEERTAIVTDSLLDIHSDIDLIYAHNDRMAITAHDHLAARGLGDVKVIGIDGTPNIGMQAVADGKIDATFLYPTEGARIFNLALDILEGRPYEKVVEIQPMSPITSGNADILLRQEQLLKDESAKIYDLKGHLDQFWKEHSAQRNLLTALMIIVVLMVVVLFLFIRTFWEHRRHQNALREKNHELEMERDKLDSLYHQLDEATRSKLMFFTNVSHDLRTPLTLISEPIEQLKDAHNLTQPQRSMIEIADRNVHILKRLIDQVLDFRKYENGKLELVASEVDFASLAREWTSAFAMAAVKRNIRFTTDIPSCNIPAAIDPEKMERVVFNLISNAFKYTPDNGKVHFQCNSDGSSLTFSVSDTGRGISPVDLSNVFERFYQVDKVHPNGSGIGLSLAKAFVEMHGGKISLSSEVGKGSTFTVTIPVRHVDNDMLASAPATLSPASAADLQDIGLAAAGIDDCDTSRPLVLIIDDNADIRALVASVLADEYRVVTASDGREGLRMAAKFVPDAIVCDVMMPEMDGLQCCRHLKEEISTSHIPVVMLTACSLDEQRVQGYDSGADGYLSKPFNSKVLRSRLGNLITNRRRIKDIFSNPLLPREATTAVSPNAGKVPSAPAPGPIDNDFYNRFAELVNKNLGDSELSVESLATRMGLGQSQFTRKIKALTNYTPVELIRRFRLNEARRLLSSSDASVSEIAYGVGFTSPAYFSKCYRDAFGETPSELRSRLGK